MQNRFVKPVLIGALALTMLGTVGCDRTKSIKAEDKKPAKLLKIDHQVNVLTLVGTLSLPQNSKLPKGSKINKKDSPNLQIVDLGQQFVTASRAGRVSVYQGTVQLWSLDVKDIITSGVGADLVSNIAVVGTRSGQVVAIDLKSKSILWQKALPSSSLAPALVGDNKAIISANDGVIYALDLQTGEQVWQFSTQTPNVSVRGAAKPLRLDSDVALFGMADGRIHAISVATGRPFWTRRIGQAVGGSQVHRMSDVDGQPLVVGTHLYVASYSGQLAGFDMTTGQTMFVSPLASTKSLTAQGSLVVGSSIDGDVVAFDRITGEKAWQNSDLKYRQLTNPVTVGAYVAVGDAEGVIHILNSQGNIVGRYQGKEKITSLYVSNGRLYAQTADDKIVIWQING